MEAVLLLVGILICLVALMFSGLPVALCFLFIDIVGVTLLWGGASGLQQLAVTMFQSVTDFTILSIPMFILLGEIIFGSKVGTRTIDAVDKWMGRIPGRLGLIAVGSGTIFAALSGTNVGVTAMLGKTLIPEMMKRGYKKPISIGSVIGAGGMAMLIPPSAIAVVWGAIAEVSVGRLLMAGAVPGFIMAFTIAGYIIIRCALQPSIAPRYELKPIPFFKKLWDTVVYVLPLGLVVFAVTGIIFVGVATPSEAAAVGALAAFVLAAAYGDLNWTLTKEIIASTLRITGTIFIILASAKAFGQVLAFTGATQQLISIVLGMGIPPALVVIVMMFILLVMGCFMNAMPMILITLPLFMPIIRNLGLDPVWFGTLFLINIDIGELTPPFGVRLFVMKAVAPAGTTMGEIILAMLPFLGCSLLTLVVVLVFPELALWFPRFMFK
jgi:tripartite ATP-independent transporter DctM subunit